MTYAHVDRVRNIKNAAALRSKNFLMQEDKEWGTNHREHREESQRHNIPSAFSVPLRLIPSSSPFVPSLLRGSLSHNLEFIGVDTVVVRRFASTDCCF
ncbi:MAG: hypothetical protein K0R78_2369 [Pelosinus sp.]|jgi:hypothetical protein|nr:hypothetical protein [Pelosinus sp.]